jgi:pimeloyl-ACP methyl ester carboxylesterase
MVHISDNEALLDIFEGLSCRKVFMYGEQYRSLPYLGRLSRAGIELAEIQHAGHFILYTNPIDMWQRIAHTQLVTDMEVKVNGH